LDFGEAEEAGIQLDANENEGDLDANNEENFDPWALPEFKDVGPNWSGNIYRFPHCL